MFKVTELWSEKRWSWAAGALGDSVGGPSLHALSSPKLLQGIWPNERFQAWWRVKGAIGSVLGGKQEGRHCSGCAKGRASDLGPKIKSEDHYMTKHITAVKKVYKLRHVRNMKSFL